MNDNDKHEGDGVALQSTRHPYNITPEMVAAGYAALEGSPLSLWPQKLENVYTAMRDSEPVLPEDIDPDSVEEVQMPTQAMWDAEVLWMAKVMSAALRQSNEALYVEVFPFMQAAQAVVEARWGKRP